MSSFKKDLIAFIDTIEGKKKYLTSEESTKMALISPLLTLMGYNVFNPEEVRCEYIADVGIKKGEKVDYAIVDNDMPQILVEAKCTGDDLSKHYSQLYRYFSTTTAKFAILTDGVIYRFYSDIEEVNKMDLEPFIEIDLLNISNEDISVLEAFRKKNFNSKKLSESIVKWKYDFKIKSTLDSLFENPTDSFIEFLTGSKDIARFRPLVERVLSNYTPNASKINKGSKDTKASKEDVTVTVETGMLSLDMFNYDELMVNAKRIKPIALCVENEELYLKTWKSLVVLAIDYLYKEHKEKLRSLIDAQLKGNKIYLYSSLDALKIKYTVSNDTFVHKVDEDIYMYVNYNTTSAIDTILIILGVVGLPKDYFSLKYSVIM